MKTSRLSRSAFLLGLVALGVSAPLLRADLFSGLKDKIKDKAKEKIDDTIQEKKDEAVDKVHEKIDDLQQQVEDRAKEELHKKYHRNSQESATPAAAPTAPESNPGITTTDTSTPPPLPPADALTCRLYSREATADQPADYGTDFSTAIVTLNVEVAVKVGQNPLTFNGRIVADDVPGLRPGAVVALPTHSNQGYGSNDVVLTLSLDLPVNPPPPGKYHVELFETEAPYRAFARVPFTLHAPSLPAADDFDAVLCTQLDGGNSPVPEATGTHFSDRPEHLYAVLSTKKDMICSFTIRAVADDVEGIARGTVVATRVGTSPGYLGADRKQDYIELELRSLGLPPGKYRAEFFEEGRPFRVFKSVAFETYSKLVDGPEFNLACSQLGGAMEYVTGEDGAGFSQAWHLLDENPVNEWTPRPKAVGDANPAPVPLPFEFVISFYQHQSALVSAVEIQSAENSIEYAAREVEIWGSSEGPRSGFTRLASATNDGTKPVFRISVPPTELKFLKIRVLSGLKPEDFYLNHIRVIEGQKAGYTPLLQRCPEIKLWTVQPRYAAQHGLFFLQPNAVDWQQGDRNNLCFGCHVQTQALMAISVARGNDYVLSGAAEKALADFMANCQMKSGEFADSPEGREKDEFTSHANSAVFGTLAVIYSPDSPERADRIFRGAAAVAALQADDGSIVRDHYIGPIEESYHFFAATSVQIYNEALKIKDDPKIRAARDKAFNYLAQTEIKTTQDKAFKILAFARYGDAAQKKIAHDLCLELQAQQLSNGAWTIDGTDQDEPSPFATGQALYALRAAGISPHAPSFERGVRYLIATQKDDGSWVQHTYFPTAFASTMWPVIALTGSFGNHVEPGHLNVATDSPPPPPVTPEPPPPPAAPKTSGPVNLELILDCSFSMNDDLGDQTRLATAKTVLKDLINHLPDNVNVGLRFYGHRYSTFSFKTSTDSELVHPIQRLDRPGLIALIDKVKARGETPLVYSILQAGDDLKKIGGGTIVTLTDGEENCGGEPRKAGATLLALGVPIHLDIVGFTVSGSRVISDMLAMTTPTGGHYYKAANALQLALALNTAAQSSVGAVAAAPLAAPVPPPPPAPQEYKYDVFNAAGDKVGTSSTSDDGLDLEPGEYRVVLHDGAKDITCAGMKLKSANTANLRYDPAKAVLSTALGGIP